MAKLAQLRCPMDNLPEELLAEIIKRVTKTSDLNSLSLVSKRLYTIEAGVRDAIRVGCGLCPVTLALTSLCSRFSNLSKVEFNYCGWTADHGMQLDNKGLHAFSSCCRLLTDLTLSFCLSINDSGLGFLTRFEKLISLRLNTLPAITSSGLLLLASGCKSLSAFHLIGCKKVDAVEWLEYLGKFGSLEELVVKYCKRISQFDLLVFGPGFVKLQKFEFEVIGLPATFDPNDPSDMVRNQYRNDPYDPLDVAHIKYKYDFCCENLMDLALARITTVPEMGLRYLLKKCKALENICLSYVLGLDDNDMIELAQNCSNLRSMSLWLQPQFNDGYIFRTPLTDSSLMALALRCSKLQSVELMVFACDYDWPEIGFTQEGLMVFVQSCPIRDLVLFGANILNDEGMKALSCAQFLESLKLIDCYAITDAGMRFLAHSPRLINLTLWQCRGLTDEGVGNMACGRKLESLNIEGCSHISLQSVQGAAKSVHFSEGNPSWDEWLENRVSGSYDQNLAR